MDSTGFDLPELSRLVIPEGPGKDFAFMPVFNYNA